MVGKKERRRKREEEERRPFLLELEALCAYIFVHTHTTQHKPRDKLSKSILLVNVTLLC